MTTSTVVASHWRLLQEADPDIAKAIRDELRRQSSGLELIASENFVSRAILEAAGSVFTNKYAEGYPGRRYYGGCEYVDIVESLAIGRAKSLFKADHANVQPHAGAPANMAVLPNLTFGSSPPPIPPRSPNVNDVIIAGGAVRPPYGPAAATASSV